MIEGLRPNDSKRESEDFGREGTSERDFSLNPSDGRASEEDLEAVRATLDEHPTTEKIIPVDFKAEASAEEILVKPTAKSGSKWLNRIKTFIGLGAVMGALGNEAKAQDVTTSVGAQPEVGPKVVFQASSPTVKPKIFNYDQKQWSAVTEKDKEISRQATENLKTGKSFWGGNPGTPPSNEPIPVNPPGAQESVPEQQDQRSSGGGVVHGGQVGGGPTYYGGFVPGGRVDRRGVSRGGDRYYGPVSQDGYVKEYNAGGPRQARRAAQLHQIVKDSGNEAITDGNELFKNPFKGKFFKPKDR